MDVKELRRRQVIYLDLNTIFERRRHEKWTVLYGLNKRHITVSELLSDFAQEESRAPPPAPSTPKPTAYRLRLYPAARRPPRRPPDTTADSSSARGRKGSRQTRTGPPAALLH